MKLYVDSNVYLDFLLDRKNKQLKDLSEKAYILFRRSGSCEFKIILSDHVLRELDKHMNLSETTSFFKLLEKKIIKVKMKKSDEEKAKSLKTHYEDALHIVLAKKAKADVIVTRNKVDFKHLFETYLPEEL